MQFYSASLGTTNSQCSARDGNPATGTEAQWLRNEMLRFGVAPNEAGPDRTKSRVLEGGKQKKMTFNGDLMVFNGDLMVFNGD